MKSLAKYVLASTLALSACSRLDGQPYRQMVRAVDWIKDNESRVEDVARKIPSRKWKNYSLAAFISDNHEGTDEYENVIYSSRMIEYGVENCRTGGFYWDDLLLGGVNRCGLDKNGYLPFDSALGTVSHEKSHSLQDAHVREMRFRTPVTVTFSLAVKHADIPYAIEAVHSALYKSDLEWKNATEKVLDKVEDHTTLLCELLEIVPEHGEDNKDYYTELIDDSMEKELQKYADASSTDFLKQDGWLELRDGWGDVRDLQDEILFTGIDAAQSYDCKSQVADVLDSWRYD